MVVSRTTTNSKMETFDICFVYVMTAFAVGINWQIHQICCKLTLGYFSDDRAVKNLVDRGWSEDGAAILQGCMTVFSIAIFSPAVVGTWYLFGWGGVILLTVLSHAYMLFFEYLRR